MQKVPTGRDKALQSTQEILYIEWTLTAYFPVHQKSPCLIFF
jgi:hypothetical protein